MFLNLLLNFILATGSGPMDSALQATEAPNTLRAAFTVELSSDTARRVYRFDPREKGEKRWQVVDWQGEDDELEAVGAAWAAEAAPDGRLFPDDLRASLGPQVQVDDKGWAWKMSFHHTPSSNDGEYDVWAASRLAATAWLDPVGERFLRTEPHWGMSYVSGFSIDLEARAAFRTIHRRYSANIVKADFFFASKQAQDDFEASRPAAP